MTPRTKEQNEDIRQQRLAQIRIAAADVFLNKGPLLEIRDVAAQAGLGYGTVYHYYSNKGDLLNDLLWDALVRAGGWLEAPTEVPSASASGEVRVGGQFGLAAAADTGNSAAADSISGNRETAAELGPVAAACVRLLQLWAGDHGLYLLYKLAGEGFASLPEARSTPLSAAFRKEVLAPFAVLLETGRAADGAAASGGTAAEPPYRLQRAEMLIAALVGCASISLRFNKLHEEARDIARFLKL
ncbi:AcrR family transcriptional regulator [Paenibacillus endophyticus]|uniref:AcrR family transcriptional regulator n=1 Tax=Paenibacillus endophyticus TaxID=1294268 RepID=A0A7W5GCH3_9BACL|nr:TetR/AcrR family transcriptional regulator [Paenibacillus endophyticus]MBB3155409.1 AcrR family transcriptional regulator [Paenibacillus endophyticus]